VDLDEIYDIVDKKGNKIGKANWTQIHTKGLLHQNVHGLLFKNSDLKETLIKRRTISVAQEAGKYEISVAGHMLSGESPDRAIKRELAEELFNNTLPKDILIRKVAKYFNHDIPNNYEIAHLFRIIYNGDVTLQREEADEIIWVNWGDLVQDIKKTPSKYAQYSLNAVNAYIENTER
jgi:isopentenyldiphosphate isomerase